MSNQPSPPFKNNVSQNVQSYIPGAFRPDKRVRLRRRRKWPAAVAIICVLAIGITVGISVWRAKEAENTRNETLAPYANAYLPNITLDGIALTGLTRAEAETAVMNQVNARQDGWSLALTYNGHTFTTLNYTLMGMTTDKAQVRQLLDRAYQYGHTGTVDERLAALAQLQEAPVSLFSSQSDMTDSNLNSILSQIAAYFDQAPTDAYLASFDPDAADPFVIVPEKPGATLDVDTARAEIMRRASAGESGSYELTPSPIPAKVTTADVRKRVTLLSTGTTKIATTSPEGRNSNIAIAMEKINGKMLKNGETFSFNSVVGKRTEENGFVPAIEYVYGIEQPGIGGGVCQVSTTVYMAAITANMELLQRSPHSMKVSYTELGHDATVSNNRLDLSFRNNTGGTVYITAHVENQPKTKKRWQCTVNIYGPAMAENEHYELRSEVVDVLLPGDPILRKDTDGVYVEYEDEMYQFQTGREGYVITTYLDRYVNGEVVGSRKLYTDTYKATSDGYYVGVKPRDEFYY